MSDQLTHYLNAWNLSDPRPLAETFTSRVYTVKAGGETVILKILTPVGAEETKGAAALRYYNGQGAVKLLRDDDGAHLLEYVDGDDLTPIVRRGGDAQATEIVADVLNKLHHPRLQTPPQNLWRLDRWFQALFRKAEADQHAGVDSLFVRAAPIAAALLADPRDVRVLHGDIHHENIRYHATRGWLAFDPKGLCGERAYDTANTLYNPMNMPALVENESRLLSTVEILAQRTGLDFDRLMSFVFVYGCLSASWSLEDQQEAESALRIAALAEPHVRRP